MRTRAAAGLTRERIVAAALQLLDEAGLEGLTTRALAARLGVQSPALYWHFPNKRALADAVAAAMLAPQDWPGPDTPGFAAPAAWLAGRAHAFRRALLAHRDGAAIHADSTPDPALLPGLDRQLESLVAHGLPPADALRTVQAISRYTIGWVLEEQADAPGGAAALLSAAAATPVLVQAAAAAKRGDPDADFDWGLQALIAGALASRRPG